MYPIDARGDELPRGQKGTRQRRARSKLTNRNGRPKKETTMRPTIKPLIPKIFAVLVRGSTALVHAGGARAQDKVTYQLGWIPTGEYAPYFAGVAKGFYKQEGIDLVMSRGFGSGDTVKKVAGGGAMLGEADISTVMLAAI